MQVPAASFLWSRTLLPASGHGEASLALPLICLGGLAVPSPGWGSLAKVPKKVRWPFGPRSLRQPWEKQAWPWELLSHPGWGRVLAHPCLRCRERSILRGAGLCPDGTGGRQGCTGTTMLRASLLPCSALPRSPLQQATARAVLQFKPSLGRKGEWAGSGVPRSEVCLL